MTTLPYPAPSFDVMTSEGRALSLSMLRGQWVVLYFYPKDDTPACTTQACSLRDVRAELAALGAHVIGVSKDDKEQHNEFKEKYQLWFDLVPDTEADMITAYGAWGKKQFGKEGILRKTFLIDPEGMVQKVYGRATPLGHGEKVVADLRQLQQRA